MTKTYNRPALGQTRPNETFKRSLLAGVTLVAMTYVGTAQASTTEPCCEGPTTPPPSYPPPPSWPSPAPPPVVDQTNEIVKGIQQGTSSVTPVSRILDSLPVDRGGQNVLRQALRGGETGLAAAAAGSHWNIWAAYTDNKVENDFTPLQTSGHVYAGLAGVDYTLDNGVIVGLAFSGERTRTDAPNGGNLRGNGYSIAPYLSWQIDRNWFVDGTLGWGRTDLDNNLGGGVTGSNDDKRKFAGLSGSYVTEIDKAILTGRVSYLYAEDRFSSFTLSNGTAISSNTSRIGQIRLGGQVGYAGDGFMPYLALYYVNDVQRPALPTIAGQSPANDRDGVLIQIGINFFSRGGLAGGLMFATESNRSQITNDQFLANISFRF